MTESSYLDDNLRIQEAMEVVHQLLEKDLLYEASFVQVLIEDHGFDAETVVKFLTEYVNSQKQRNESSEVGAASPEILGR
ncbi:hypothetical protein SAMN05660420_02246 [Desulfuromusa kysingii]|uniref:Uncharacterized protein n=1 Tax=Desulfuromusa kysingii TaxID=37625 RepID=A0A1H4BJT5_9BACT|nr:hypothetical protein [Desulfuromusa kysingii]SEA48390.1 hypothetical protein SAMN05660420_02246 [Desulfuromusa kysingii]